MTNTLLLNADYMPMDVNPISTITWQDSVKAHFSDNLTIVKLYDDLIVRSPGMTFEVPSVVVATTYRKRKEYATLNRRNLYLRDKYTCQYCNIRFLYGELTYDHVIPKAAGGKNEWENLVAACKHCNSKKGHSQGKMTPVNKPYKPTWHQMYDQSKCYKLTVPDASWQQFLNWPDHLLEIQSPKLIY